MAESITDLFTELQTERYSKKNKSLDQRKYVRFTHNKGKQLFIKLKNAKGEWVEPHAFINNESFGGFGILIVSPVALVVNQPCQVNVPGVGWVQSQIAWIKYLHESLQEIGLKYC